MRESVGATSRLICLDTSVWIAYLAPDEQKNSVTSLVGDALRDRVFLVAPSFAWSEIGSVFRKKIRARLLEQEQASVLFRAFQDLAVESVDTPVIRFRAWEIARQYSLPTLYDAAFLACTELAVSPDTPISDRTFWTADRDLIRMLGTDRPPYVRLIV